MRIFYILCFAAFGREIKIQHEKMDRCDKHILIGFDHANFIGKSFI